MSKPSSFADAELDVEPGTSPQPQPVDPENPFRVLILGDFSGRANRGAFETGVGSRRRVIPIDRDTFDDAMGALRPELLLPLAGTRSPALAIRFGTLDDFHPDRLFERVDIFQALAGLREKLSDSATFAAAAEALQTAEPPPPLSAQPRITLDELLEETNGGPAGTARAFDDWNAVLRELVAPHLMPGAGPLQAEMMIAQVDAATSDAMRALLHQPAFQDLEAAWRSVFFLVQRLGVAAGLKLYLLDVSKTELAAELESARDNLSVSDLWRTLVEESADAPWAVLAGNYSFGHSPGDLKLLARLGSIAHAAGAPFLAATTPQLLEGFPPNAFFQIRKLPQAPSIGLALPRFLLRQPYSSQPAPTERLAFEEFAGVPKHEWYLWGNPAFGCVLLLGQAFQRAGWDMQPGLVSEIDGLTTELLMTDQGAEGLLACGIIPFAWSQPRDPVRLIRFQSIADPPAPLAGRWRN